MNNISFSMPAHIVPGPVECHCGIVGESPAENVYVCEPEQRQGKSEVLYLCGYLLIFVGLEEALAESVCMVCMCVGKCM